MIEGCSGPSEEVLQKLVAVTGENTLGMKLHTFDIECAMSDTHYHSVSARRSDGKFVGNTFGSES